MKTPASRLLLTLGVLLAINTLNFYDRQVLGAVAEPVRKELDLDDAQYGWLTPAFVLLYAAAAIVATHQHPSAWRLEYTGSLPAAISHAVYGAPLGQYDTNVYAVFFDLNRTGVTAQSVEKAVAETARGTLPHGARTLANEGIGAGQPLFMGFAAALFGLFATGFFLGCKENNSSS